MVGINQRLIDTKRMKDEIYLNIIGINQRLIYATTESGDSAEQHLTKTSASGRNIHVRMEINMNGIDDYEIINI